MGRQCICSCNQLQSAAGGADSEECGGVRAGRRHRLRSISAVKDNPAERIANFDDNVAAQRWFVMPLWQPRYVCGTSCAFWKSRTTAGGTDRAWLIAKDLRVKVNTQTEQALQRMSVTEMDYLVKVKEMSARAPARAWIGAHPDAVSHRLEPED